MAPDAAPPVALADRVGVRVKVRVRVRDRVRVRVKVRVRDRDRGRGRGRGSAVENPPVALADRLRPGLAVLVARHLEGTHIRCRSYYVSR